MDNASGFESDEYLLAVPVPAVDRPDRFETCSREVVFESLRILEVFDRDMFCAHLREDALCLVLLSVVLEERFEHRCAP